MLGQMEKPDAISFQLEVLGAGSMVLLVSSDAVLMLATMPRCSRPKS